MNEQMNIDASSSLKKATTECSTQLVSEKEEVRSLFESEKEEVKSLFASEKQIFLEEIRKLREEFKADERSKTQDVHQLFSDEVGYLRETRFDMIETCAKMKEASNKFDYCWRRFAMTMSEAKSALEDAMTRLMSPILSSVV